MIFSAAFLGALGLMGPSEARASQNPWIKEALGQQSASGSIAAALEARTMPGAPSFAELEKAVDEAVAVTGIRKDFLMGMLVVESDLGRNQGQCTYSQVEEQALDSHKKGKLSVKAWRTFEKRREIIKRFSKELGYDYHKVLVSCNPSNYAGTGGALGIAQFMPDTWLEYEERIARHTGAENPDPWNFRHGVMAMALKLSDVPGVKEHETHSERNAAKLYLSGTTSYAYNWYANQILYWAANYRSLVG
ncbi:MAG TPA: lytic murein transglycosylase [Candidatus Moranbacteria bacterium]|nr:lytic murein transglycosylase [Candidatus Moranbacteria bacterium]